MIKEALQYLTSLAKRDATVEVNGEVYLLDENGLIDRSLAEFNHYEQKSPLLSGRNTLETSTLQSIADYITHDPDDILSRTGQTPIIHIESATEVSLYASMDEYGRRSRMVRAKAITPALALEQFVEVQQFIIQMQSQFADTDDKATILQIVSKITEDASQTTTDTGLSQAVTIRDGVNLDDVLLPNPVELAPFRTFVEVEQPRSYYVVRVDKGPSAALYTARGNEWQIDAMSSIREFFFDALADTEVNFHIIA